MIKLGYLPNEESIDICEQLSEQVEKITFEDLCKLLAEAYARIAKLEAK